MAKQNYSHEKKRNYLEDMSQLIAEIDRLKVEPECNISCPPFECSLRPYPEMCCDNNTYNSCCISNMPPVPQQHTQPSSLSDKLQFSSNLDYPSTSTSSYTHLAPNPQCNLTEATQICYSPIAPRSNWETSIIEIPENPDYTPRLNYYCERKPFRSHCPSNQPRKEI